MRDWLCMRRGLLILQQADRGAQGRRWCWKRLLLIAYAADVLKPFGDRIPG
jgi:hypothetical protein